MRDVVVVQTPALVQTDFDVELTNGHKHQLSSVLAKLVLKDVSKQLASVGVAIKSEPK
jgi:hypothetical protein